MFVCIVAMQDEMIVGELVKARVRIDKFLGSFSKHSKRNANSVKGVVNCACDQIGRALQSQTKPYPARPSQTRPGQNRPDRAT